MLVITALAQGPAQADTPDGIIEIRFATGFSATIYTSEYLADRTLTQNDRGILHLDDGQYLPVITDIDDPFISNKGDGRFHPFNRDLVISSLEQIEYPNID
ncbi:MAG: hypothetical protein P8181_15725, partial [bacterium]